MKPIINVLDQATINKVAAGEVIERPCFVVKELVENSIDAGATSIIIEIKEGGLKLIKVSDNGTGIPSDQVLKAFLRNATSKIKLVDDIEKDLSYGFRGEALASIAAVSTVEMTTRWEEDEAGSYIECRAGDVITNKFVGSPKGTTISIKNLFFNAPARLKFLKKIPTESSYCNEFITKLALANPEISIKFVKDDKTIFHTSGNSNLLDAIKSVYSPDIERELLKIDFIENGVKISGFAGKASISRGDKKNRIYFINSRWIKNDNIINSAISRAYDTVLMTRKFPFIILNIEIETQMVDVNVHPAKLEVRFSNEALIYSWVYKAIKNTIEEDTIKISPLSGLKAVELLTKIENGEIEKNEDEIKSVTSMEKIIEDECVKDNEKIKEFSNVKDYTNKEDIITNNIISNYDDKFENKNICNSFDATKQISNCDKSNNMESFGNADKFDKNDIVSDDEVEQIRMDSMGRELVNDIYIENFKYIGQVFDTYLLIEKDYKMILIDQHAAHERLNYEKLLGKFLNTKIDSQILIRPEIVKLSIEDYDLVFSKKAFMEDLGFEFEEFGDNTIAVRSVPNLVFKINWEELFLETLEEIKISKINSIYELKKDLIASMACKMSIKANKHLSDLEIKQLLKDILSLDKATCPHGRPLMIEYSKKEIEKSFKRIL